MMRAATVALLVAVGVGARADTSILWIDRPAARPWLPAVNAAAQRAHLTPATVAELVGTESGFQTIRNPRSSAFGCGQQIDSNAIMRRYRLDRSQCDQSIMGAALQLRECLDDRGTMAAALSCYGTTAGLSPGRRKQILARFDRVAAQMVAQQVAPVTVGQLHIP
jgi:hypothetical protein